MAVLQKHEREALAAARIVAQAFGGEVDVETVGRRGHPRLVVTIGTERRIVGICRSPQNRDTHTSYCAANVRRACREMAR